MEAQDQKRITRNMIKIRNTIEKDVVGIAKKLVEKKVITDSQYEDICNVKPKIPHLQCGMLINKLLRSGPDAFPKFMKILAQRGYRKLADTIESTCVDDNSNVFPRSREGTFVISSPRLRETPSKQKLDNANRTTKPCPVIDEVKKLERMMTFVLTKLDDKDVNNNKVGGLKTEFSTISEEAQDNDELVGFFRTLRHSSFQMSNQTLVH